MCGDSNTEKIKMLFYFSTSTYTKKTKSCAVLFFVYTPTMHIKHMIPKQFDEHGFWLTQDKHWLPEEPVDEKKRLEYNQFMYKYKIDFGARFPEEVNERMMLEFTRLGELNVRENI